MYVGCWAGVTYLRYTVLTSSNTSETDVHCCDPAISVLVMLVSRNVFHVVSALQSLSLFHIFSADQVSFRSYVGSVYRVRSLAVCVTHKNTYQCKIPIVPEEGWFGQPKYSTSSKNHPIRCVGFYF